MLGWNGINSLLKTPTRCLATWAIKGLFSTEGYQISNTVAVFRVWNVHVTSTALFMVCKWIYTICFLWGNAVPTAALWSLTLSIRHAQYGDTLMHSRFHQIKKGGERLQQIQVDCKCDCLFRAILYGKNCGLTLVYVVLIWGICCHPTIPLPYLFFIGRASHRGTLSIRLGQTEGGKK